MPRTSDCDEGRKLTVNAAEDKSEEVRTEHVTIDPMFLKKAKEKEESGCAGWRENVFLYTSYAIVIVEMAAALFTLSVIHFKISQSTIHKATLAYYALYCVLVSILIVDSFTQLKDYAKERAKNEISVKEHKIKKIKEISTIVSGFLWIALSVSSIVMEIGGGATPPFSLLMSSLLLSIAAPALGAFSAVTRAYEVVYSSRQGIKRITEAEDKVRNGLLSEEELETIKSNNNKKPRTGRVLYLRSSLFLVIAAFEFAHCMCHFVEAYYLLGKTHHLFYITDQVLLGTQAALALLFLVLQFLEKYFEKENVTVTPEISPAETPELQSTAETGGRCDSLACPQLEEVIKAAPLIAGQRIVA
ncbi:hypothetical protein [Anaplasma platys]|nr:hypothetical protein [Anaplasma platys]